LRGLYRGEGGGVVNQAEIEKRLREFRKIGIESMRASLRERVSPQPKSARTGVKSEDNSTSPASMTAAPSCPPLPPGVRLISYNPKSPPVAIDVCSVVTDVEKFIRAELGELNARLHSPVQIRGGWGAFTILERLRQVGVELELEPTLTKATSAQEPPKKVFRTPTGDGGAG
jgi:hypothetical protein